MEKATNSAARQGYCNSMKELSGVPGISEADPKSSRPSGKPATVSSSDSRNCKRDGPRHLGRYLPWTKWTEEQVELLKHLWSQPIPGEQIALRIGRSWDVCRAKAQRLCLGIRLSNLWPPALDAKLDELIKAGHSAREIGKAVGKTRNAVLGRAHRLGITLKKAGLSPEERLERKRQTMRRLRAKQKPASKFTPVRLRAAAAASLTPVAGLPPSLNLPIEQWTHDTCKFIAGDDRLACGHKTYRETAYCPEHFVLCTRPVGSAA